MPRVGKPDAIFAEGIDRTAPGFFGEEPSGVANIIDQPIEPRNAKRTNVKLIRSLSKGRAGGAGRGR